MAFNIMDLVKDQISDQLLGQIGNAAGTDGSQTSIAMNGALPGLLSGLASAANKPGGADALFDKVSRQDDGLLGNMGNMLGQGQGNQIADQGSSMLGSLLGGGALGKLAGALSGFAGIGQSNSSSMLGMLAPIVIGAIKKHVMGNNLDAGGLASMLSSQQSNIDSAMPGEFSGQLKAQGFFDSIGAGGGAGVQSAAPTAPAPASNASTSTHTNTHANTGSAHVDTGSNKSGGGFLKWLLPLAAVLVLGFLGMRFLGGKDAPDMPDVGDAATNAATSVQGSATDLAANASARLEGVSSEAMDAARAAMPEGVDMDNLTGQLDGVFDGTTSALGNVTDVDSATAAADKLSEASGELGKFDQVFKRLPEAAQGPLSGIISNGLGMLQPLADKVLAIPGVGPVLEPVLQPMLEKLAAMAG